MPVSGGLSNVGEDGQVATPDPESEWWTTSDVASYLGVKLGTVSSYRKRDQMPAPDQTVGRTHVWKPARIIDWHEARPRPGVGGRPDEGQIVEPHEYLQVSTATENRESAEKLARLAVQARLAAGAQITGPLISAYWHLGEFGTGEEWRLVLQTRSSRYSSLESLLRENHPWGNPEIVAIPIIAGSASYLEWIGEIVEERSAGN